MSNTGNGAGSGSNGRRTGNEDAWAEATRPADGPTGFDAERLLASVQDWVGDFFRGASVGKAAAGFTRAAGRTAFGASARRSDVWADATSAPSDTGPGASAECRYCPFCQTLAAVRHSRPDLYEQIGDTAKSLLDLVRQATEQTTRRGPRR